MRDKCKSPKTYYVGRDLTVHAEFGFSEAVEGNGSVAEHIHFVNSYGDVIPNPLVDGESILALGRWLKAVETG
jgi:hypothetical protein